MSNEIIPGFNDEKDESLKITLEGIDDNRKGLIIHLDGYIDTYNSTFFQKKINSIITEDYIQLIFDCKSLNYVSSTGIGAFTSFLKNLKPKGGNIVLVAIQPKVYEVFQLLGFSQFFVIKEDLESAINFFKTQIPPAEKNVFPKIFACPICSSKLKATRPGRFRCGECKTVLAIDSKAQVFIG